MAVGEVREGRVGVPLPSGGVGGPLQLRRVLRQPKGPGRFIDVVRDPLLLRVRRGPCLPPVVIDHDLRLMLSRTPGRILKLLRNVRGTTFLPRRRSRGPNCLNSRPDAIRVSPAALSMHR